MEISFVGFLVAAALFLTGRRLGSAPLVGLFMATSLSATAVVTLSALGGASPPVYTLFSLLLIAYVATCKTFSKDFAHFMRSGSTSWLVLGLLIYAVAGAIIMPRLFAGQVSVYEVSRITGTVIQARLAPSSANLTQTGYFVLGGLAFFALRTMLVRSPNYEVIERGLFAWASLSAALGFVDLAGKLAGGQDLLEPIRTASYAMATDGDKSISGFFRISGGHSEASAFAIATLPCLAYACCQWRLTGKSSYFLLMLALLTLLIFSTSTTAYTGGFIITMFFVASVFRSVLENKLQRRDLVLCGLALVGLVLVLGFYLADETTFERFGSLLDNTLFNKAGSMSAVERGMWNTASLTALAQTYGLGIGAGSSRTSSWLVAALSHFGIPGAAMLACLVAVLVRGLAGMQPRSLSPHDYAVVQSVRAAGLTSLVASGLAGSYADPGILFFLALAVVVAARARAAPLAATSTTSGAILSGWA